MLEYLLEYLLRKKGQKVAAKRGENDAKEGLVISESSSDGSYGVILALNCETDFVSKNDGYRQLVQSFVDLAMREKPESLEELKSLSYDNKLSVSEKIVEQVPESKIILYNFEKLSGYKFSINIYIIFNIKISC